jgi:hypothetical protein
VKSPSVSGEQQEQQEAAQASRHAFAIIRIDDFLGLDSPPEQRITVKKIVRDEGTAEREVDRLNGLQRGEGVRYFSQITRIEAPQEPTFGAPENRISRLGSSESASAAGENRSCNSKFLETIHVPEYVVGPLPGGLGCPASRALAACAFPDGQHVINWSPIETFILVKNGDGYVDVVGLYHQSAESNNVMFALRIYEDMLRLSLSELSPLAIVKAFAEEYGHNVRVGDELGRFFLEQSIMIPGLDAGFPPQNVFKIEGSVAPSGALCFITCFVPPALRIALGFCLDTAKYMAALRGR